jgi:hypothetical protein
MSSVGSVLLGMSQSGDRARVVEFARSFVISPGFAGDPSNLPMGRLFHSLATRLAAEKRFTPSILEERIEEILGQPAAQVAASTEFRVDVQKLVDGILTLTLAPAVHPTLLEEYVRLFRVADLIVKVAESAGEIDGLSYRAWIKTPLELPAGLFPLAGKPKPAPVEQDTSENIPAATPASLNAKLVTLDHVSEELLAIGSENLRVVEDPQENANQANELLALHTRPAKPERPIAEHASEQKPDDSDQKEDSAISSSLIATRVVRSRLLLDQAAIDRLSSATKATLGDLAIDLEHMALDSVIDRIEQESARVRREIELITPAPAGPATIRLGNTTVPTSLFATTPSAPSPADDFTARDTGGFTIGNLMLTNLQILRYEAGEIAHIENVLVGETKERETRRLRRTEETFVREVETIKEEERDLQTTERLEMQREVQNTVKESQQFRIGGSLSVAYGPFVQATVNTEFATDSSSEDIARNASNYSREITERTASKITERIREEQTIRVIQEFEERNLHRLDGTGQDQHIIGIFQWVDKVYQAQVYDYGVRLICQLYVPEPARFLQQAVFLEQMQQEEGNGPPDPIDFGPLDITPSNYASYVKTYRAKGVSAPPERIITLSATFQKQEQMADQDAEEGEDQNEDAAENPETVFTEARDQAIPNGYRAVRAFATATSIDANKTKGDIPYGLILFIGQQVFPFVNPDTEGGAIKGNLEFALNNEVGSIPITLIAENVTHYVAGVEIVCHRTTSALRKWQLQTYEAIVEAHQAQEADYRERLAEAAAQAGIVIEGRNPEQNRRIERIELKRLGLSMITRQHFSGFGAYDLTVPVPHIDFDRAAEQGRSIRFFEEAFEWENMAYEFESYFWTEKNRWVKKLLISDTDPLHAAFHAAGAAKVEIPIRPDYERAFFYYLNTGQIWDGGALPPIVTPAQLAVIAKLLERREVEDPHQKIAVGEPWEVRLPTTLIRVSPSAALPRWQQDENGNWQPVEQE